MEEQEEQDEEAEMDIDEPRELREEIDERTENLAVAGRLTRV
jgi:hypothetical protein